MKKSVEALRAQLSQHFDWHTPIKPHIKAYSEGLIQLLQQHWQSYMAATPNCTLVAMGSLGRESCYLYSDIDILILIDDNTPTTPISQFIQSLWDTHLDIGHIVTKQSELKALIAQEHSVLTSLLEATFLAGNTTYFKTAMNDIADYAKQNQQTFFKKKYRELCHRHKRFGHSAYQLEPNIKHSPGGIRDCEFLRWIAQVHFGSHDFLALGLLSAQEQRQYLQAQSFISKIRFYLHILTGKNENRLLFDYQQAIADKFYSGSHSNLRVEKLMHEYFRAIRDIRIAYFILLQTLREHVYHPKTQAVPVADNIHQFNGYLDFINPAMFAKNPVALIEIFKALKPGVRGLRANAIRILRTHQQSIQNTPVFRQALYDILQEPPTAALRLSRMHRYGILEQIIPELTAIIGYTQFDLFHTYTVDQHTMVLLHQLVRFKDCESQKKFPLCFKCWQAIDNPACLFIAAIFHDIAKGQNSCHATRGAELVEAFCATMPFSRADRDLTRWLVRHHLLMSMTAQREDIYDPKVIQRFSHKVGSQRRLDYLYLLTCADICATNPNLWNSWRDALLKELYLQTKQLFSTTQMLDKQRLILARQDTATQWLDYPEALYRTLWQTIPERYFTYTPARLIAEQTSTILNAKKFPVIAIHNHPTLNNPVLLVYMPQCRQQFAITATTLANANLSVLEARLLITTKQFSLGAYIINKPMSSAQALLLKQHLSDPTNLPRLNKRRRHRHDKNFQVNTQISFGQQKLMITTRDKPGLLAQISRAFSDLDIHITNAKITTAGERAIDTFYFETMRDDKQTELEKKLRLLDNNITQ